jgi:CheY-like chemotaxis protein
VVDLGVLLVDMAHMLERLIGEDIRLEVRRPPALGRVRIDTGQLEQAVLNLVVNARDAMPDGGRLALSIDEVVLPQDATDIQPELPPGRYVVLRIADTGTGMSPETLARVYEPFFTTKEVGKGTGLGLSQVYGFAQQSGGAVAIVSAPGRGTRVSLLLPRSSEVIAGDARALAESATSGRRATVLLVEDDAEVRETSIAMVQDLGHQVLIARTGAEALALIRAGNPIDVVLTDLVMPGRMSGVELAQAAVAAAPAIKVVITTGYPGHPDLLRSELPVLAKPFTRVDLETMIRALVEPSGLAPVGAA